MQRISLLKHEQYSRFMMSVECAKLALMVSYYTQRFLEMRKTRVWEKSAQEWELQNPDK